MFYGVPVPDQSIQDQILIHRCENGFALKLTVLERVASSEDDYTLQEQLKQTNPILAHAGVDMGVSRVVASDQIVLAVDELVSFVARHAGRLKPPQSMGSMGGMGGLSLPPGTPWGLVRRFGQGWALRYERPPEQTDEADEAEEAEEEVLDLDRSPQAQLARRLLSMVSAVPLFGRAAGEPRTVLCLNVEDLAAALRSALDPNRGRTTP